MSLASVPDAYDEYCYWRERSSETGSYGAARCCQWARQAWIDAEWRVNCASWRWKAAASPPKYDGWEVDYWRWRRAAARLRYLAQHDGIPPSRDLVLRYRGVVT